MDQGLCLSVSLGQKNRAKKIEVFVRKFPIAFLIIGLESKFLHRDVHEINLILILNIN